MKTRKNDDLEDARIRALQVISDAASAAVDLAAVAADKARALLTDTAKTSSDLSAHEKVCTERYGNINHHLITMDKRLDGMSNRMWGTVIGTTVCALSAVGGLAIFILTHFVK